MPYKTKLAIITSLFLWASAFVGIRAGLQDYSPEGLALLRYLVASVCMGGVYFSLPKRNRIKPLDILGMFASGAVGIGIYNLTLNYGELGISSGVASFIISQSPLVTAIFAVLFLGERVTTWRVAGFAVSMLGVALISLGEKGGFKLDASMIYIIIATISGSLFTIVQKPYLRKYHAIEATTYVIWGGTLFLSIYTPHLQHDVMHASWQSTLMVIYLGIFPAAVGYVAWSYALSQIPASRAVSFLYFMPFLATLLGWVYLNEVPAWFSLAGGLLAVAGVWLVNQSYRARPVVQVPQPQEA